MINSNNVRFCLGMLTFGLFALQTVVAEPLALLKTKTDTYANVTVISRTTTHVFIQHAQGVASLKIASLDLPTLHALGVPIPEEMLAATNPKAPKKTESLFDKAGAGLSKAGASLNLSPGLQEQVAADAQILRTNKPVLLAVLAGFAAVYLFFSYCALLICRKSGLNPSWLIWLPFVQIQPLVRAAGMSSWWCLAWFVPALNLVALVLWCMKIVKVRGRGIVAALLLLIPVTGVFTFIYLAFAGGQRPEPEEDVRPIRLEPLPA